MWKHRALCWVSFIWLALSGFMSGSIQIPSISCCLDVVSLTQQSVRMDLLLTGCQQQSHTTTMYLLPFSSPPLFQETTTYLTFTLWQWNPYFSNSWLLNDIQRPVRQYNTTLLILRRGNLWYKWHHNSDESISSDRLIKWVKHQIHT